MDPLLIKARSLARKTGLIRLINRLRPQESYEQRVHEALVSAVKPGDTIWDIGANVGVYTEQFCEWVGKDGHVVAFEPGAESCANIRQRIPNCAWLTIQNVALSENDATGAFLSDGTSVENHLAEVDEAASGDADLVEIRRGDTIAKQLGRVPNVVKVDVEGFEEEVLGGMVEIMASPELRSILVEVHFFKLENRGRANAPARMEKLLKEKGFKTKWVDASHLFAAR
jgi:FkbM family methyltransferase